MGILKLISEKSFLNILMLPKLKAGNNDNVEKNCHFKLTYAFIMPMETNVIISKRCIYFEWGLCGIVGCFRRSLFIISMFWYDLSEKKTLGHLMYIFGGTLTYMFLIREQQPWIRTILVVFNAEPVQWYRAGCISLFEDYFNANF